MSCIAAVAYNSCTGSFLRACHRYDFHASSLAKRCAIRAISMAAVPILSTVDAAISLTMCALIVPLIYWKEAPFIDLVASVASLVASIFLVLTLCGKRLPPVGQRNFISGTSCGLIEEVERKESESGPPVENDAGLQKLRQFAVDPAPIKLLRRRGVFLQNIPVALSSRSPAEFCDYLEMAIQKGVHFESQIFSHNELLRCIFKAEIKKDSWDQENADRFIKVMSRLGLTIEQLFDESTFNLIGDNIRSMPILQALLKQPGSISPAGEVVNPLTRLFERDGTNFFENLQKLNQDLLSPQTILSQAKEELCEWRCSCLSRVVNSKRAAVLEIFLKQKASPESTDPIGRNLLTVLITGLDESRIGETSKNMLLKLLLLLEYGADLKKNWLGHTLFDWADHCSGHDREINGIVILDQVYQCLNGFRATASLEQVVHSINVASEHGYPNVIKRLIPNLRRCLETASNDERAACESKLLLAAIRSKNVGCVDALLENQVGVDCMVFRAVKNEGNLTTTGTPQFTIPNGESMPSKEAFEVSGMMEVLKNHSTVTRDAIHKQLEAAGAAFPNTVTALIQEYWLWNDLPATAV